MERVSEAQYKEALLIVEKYQEQRMQDVTVKIPALKADLDKLFENTYIEKYFIEDISIEDDEMPMVKIHPQLYDNEHDYKDEKMDKAIGKIGLKHGLNVVTPC